MSAHWFEQDLTPVYFLNTVLFIVFTLCLHCLDHVFINFPAFRIQKYTLSHEVQIENEEKDMGKCR